MSQALETGARPLPTELSPSRSSTTFGEGMIAGVLGAATIALLFLAVDAIRGRPLLTPTVLGTAIFRGGQGLDSPETLAISGEMVFLFTWIHTLVFAAIGGLAAHGVALAERDEHLGFGLVLLFVGLEIGFVLASLVIAEGVLKAIPWQAVLVGNLLAAAVMATYLVRRHPNLRILP